MSEVPVVRPVEHQNVDMEFTRALPKAELHAHLTGSISRKCLHEIWEQRRANGETATKLEDPLHAIRPGGVHHDIFTFFKLFDTYIYELCNDEAAVRYCTERVLQEFQDDGVRYLELRTTPREAPDTGLTKDVYVSTILDTIKNHGRGSMSTYLILSIDRHNSPEQAMQAVRLAIKYQSRGVVGVDLCGNPLAGDVTIFKDAFDLAKSNDLKITLHFAELPQSSSEAELRTLLAYQPDRIGHVINVPPEIEAEIESRNLGLELCLSCNVHARMISGGFSSHHFGKWYPRQCPIALSTVCIVIVSIFCGVTDSRKTDDVGVFDSPLSKEYLLVAEHFGLDREALIALSRDSIACAFGGPYEKQRFLALLAAFEDE